MNCSVLIVDFGKSDLQNIIPQTNWNRKILYMSLSHSDIQDNSEAYIGSDIGSTVNISMNKVQTPWIHFEVRFVSLLNF